MTHITSQGECGPALRAALESAIAFGASDLHAEYDEREETGRFRMRLDAELTALDVRDAAHHDPVNPKDAIDDAAKLAGGSGGLAEGQLLLTGPYAKAPDGVQVRFVVMPVLGGKQLIARLRYMGEDRIAVNMGEEAAASVARMMEGRDGLVILSGASGTGRTTTLYETLRRLREDGGDGHKIVSIAQVHEQRLDGISQVEPKRDTGAIPSDAHLMKMILRADADTVSIDEIRTPDMLRAAIDGASCGTRIIASLHARTAVATIDRKRSMKADAARLGFALRGIVHHTLANRVCELCCTKAEDGASLSESSTGCHQCHGRGRGGMAGRVLICETIEATRALRAALLDGDAEQVAHELDKATVVRFDDEADRLVREGVISLQERKRLSMR